MNRYLTELSEGLQACDLVAQRVLLAVSGGADSVAMLRGIDSFRHRFRLTLRVAHLNHELRDAQSRDDANWVSDLCERLGVPIIVGSRDTRKEAQDTGCGLEETARRVRYEFLQECAQELDVAYIVVAHTSEDQTETILHHIIRGTGISGLRGIPRSRPLNSGAVLVRPQLEISRCEIEGYLQLLNQSYRTDESNLDPSYTRNRIRHQLMPWLASEFNPQFSKAIRRLGRQAYEAEQVIDSLCHDLLEQAVTNTADGIVRLDCTVLSAQPPYLVRACFVRLWKKLGWPLQRMGFREWDLLQQLIHGQGTATLPGKIEAKRRGELLVLRRC